MIELQNIEKSFLFGAVTVPVLKHVSVAINKGEMVAILGPSGSGKSTLMNLIGCLDMADSGEYVLDGTRINGLSSNELAAIRSDDISFIFQSFHLLPGKTVFQNVMLPLRYRRNFKGDMHALTRQALTQAHLEEEQRYKKPNQLSGGQRQRVAIARALVVEPKLLLADEPTGNLDSKTGVNVMEELKLLNERLNTTIIIVTHDEMIARMVDRIITIKDGIVSEGI